MQQYRAAMHSSTCPPGMAGAVTGLPTLEAGTDAYPLMQQCLRDSWHSQHREKEIKQRYQRRGGVTVEEPLRVPKRYRAPTEEPMSHTPHPFAILNGSWAVRKGLVTSHRQHGMNKHVHTCKETYISGRECST